MEAPTPIPALTPVDKDEFPSAGECVFSEGGRMATGSMLEIASDSKLARDIPARRHALWCIAVGLWPSALDVGSTASNGPPSDPGGTRLFHTRPDSRGLLRISLWLDCAVSSQT